MVHLSASGLRRLDENAIENGSPWRVQVMDPVLGSDGDRNRLGAIMECRDADRRRAFRLKPGQQRPALELQYPGAHQDVRRHGVGSARLAVDEKDPGTRSREKKRRRCAGAACACNDDIIVRLETGHAGLLKRWLGGGAGEVGAHVRGEIRRIVSCTVDEGGLAPPHEGQTHDVHARRGDNAARMAAGGPCDRGRARQARNNPGESPSPRLPCRCRRHGDRVRAGGWVQCASARSGMEGRSGAPRPLHQSKHRCSRAVGSSSDRRARSSSPASPRISPARRRQRQACRQTRHPRHEAR